jgi:outer membrane protein OmpA-like peptidoglycan-associated protein
MKKTTLFLIIAFVFSQVESGSAQTSYSFYFESNSSTLADSCRSKIQKMAEFMTKNKVDSIQIYGFTDQVGSVASNLILAKGRIQAVQQIFPKRNKGPVQLFAQGENYSLSHFHFSPSKLALWRRVDVLVYNTKLENKSNSEVEESEPSQFSTLNLDSLPVEPIRLKIQFVGGTAELLPISVPEIRGLYTFLAENPQVKAFIRGHVCCENDYNLSVERAEMVYQLLVRAGIGHDRLERQGFSNSKPTVSPERTEYDRQQNRRVDVIFSL